MPCQCALSPQVCVFWFVSYFITATANAVRARWIRRWTWPCNCSWSPLSLLLKKKRVERVRSVTSLMHLFDLSRQSLRQVPTLQHIQCVSNPTARVCCWRQSVASTKYFSFLVFFLVLVFFSLRLSSRPLPLLIRCCWCLSTELFSGAFPKTHPHISPAPFNKRIHCSLRHVVVFIFTQQSLSACYPCEYIYVFEVHFLCCFSFPSKIALRCCCGFSRPSENHLFYESEAQQPLSHPPCGMVRFLWWLFSFFCCASLTFNLFFSSFRFTFFFFACFEFLFDSLFLLPHFQALPSVSEFFFLSWVEFLIFTYTRSRCSEKATIKAVCDRDCETQAGER